MFGKFLTAMTLALSIQAIAAETPAPFSPSVIGVLDVRPSWTSKAGTWGTENAAEIGAKVAPNLTTTYVQEFTSNLYNDKLATDASGLSPTIGRGFLRAKVGNILTEPLLGSAMSTQTRVYLPISAADRDAGFVTIIRQYFNFTKKLSDAVSVTLTELPIALLYSRPGNVKATGPSANPIFENRVYLTTDITLTERLSFSFPVMFHQTRYRDYDAAAKNNNAWQFFVWTYPELTYAITPNFSTGIAFYSDNLVKSDLSGLSIGSGLESGVFQLVATASL